VIGFPESQKEGFITASFLFEKRGQLGQLAFREHGSWRLSASTIR